VANCLNAVFTLPDLLPISELRQRQNEILRRIETSPVVLTQHGRAAAVLVSPECWNAIVEELEDLRDLQLVAEQKEEYRANPSSARRYSDARADMVDEGLLDE
jgi:antitoxin StbD